MKYTAMPFTIMTIDEQLKREDFKDNPKDYYEQKNYIEKYCRRNPQEYVEKDVVRCGCPNKGCQYMHNNIDGSFSCGMLEKMSLWKYKISNK